MVETSPPDGLCFVVQVNLILQDEAEGYRCSSTSFTSTRTMDPQDVSGSTSSIVQRRIVWASWSPHPSLPSTNQ